MFQPRTQYDVLPDKIDIRVAALRDAMPGATLVEGNRFGGVAAGLAYAGSALAE